VVLCNAQAAAKFVPELRIGISAGQVSLIGSQKKALSSIFSHKGYVIPQTDGYVIGATYDHDDFSGAVTEKNHRENLATLKQTLPGWLTDETILSGRTSLRASTPDRLPYVGGIKDGLYISVGFGSRGMISAPLAAEVIASQLCGEVVPLSRELRAAVAPLRYAT